MENHKQSLILEWLKKYILMRDLKARSPEVLSSCIKLLIIPFLAFYLILLMMFEIQYAHNFNKLDVLNGTVKINHYTQKQGKYGREPVMDLHVISESTDVIYYISPIRKSDQLFVNSNKIEGQQVMVWYLPDNNNFYLIKFLKTNEFNDFMIVKKTQNELIRDGNYAKFWFPLKSFLAILGIVIVQLLAIRFEIFRNYDLYFVEQRWDWQRPIKTIVTARLIIVFTLLLVWTFLSVYEILKFLWS